MKGKSIKGSFYAGAGSKVASESKAKTDGFKRGGKAKAVEMMGGKSKDAACRKPRKSGGAVLSSAASGTPRGKSSHY